MECFRSSKVLVVGGAGFVGSNLVRGLLPYKPREIFIIDNLLSAERDNIPSDPAVTFTEGSITDERILAAIPADVDYVFHLATFHGNQNSLFDPLTDHEHNTLTTLKLYECIKDMTGIQRVVYASAGCTVAEKTYDQPRGTSEDAPVSLYLDSPYQMSKVFGEFYSNYYWQRHGLPVVKARFQNVYGPGEILGAGKWRGTTATVWRNVTPTFIYRALKGMPLPLDNAGRATRDFIYVSDIVDGLLRCAAYGRRGDVYNLASGYETSIRKLAETINELAGNPSELQVRPPRDWDRSGRRYGSTAKARSDISFTATTSLREGLQRTIDWTREHLDLIEACIGRHEHHLQAA